MIEPRSEEELTEVVKAAQGPLAVQGGGTRVSADRSDSSPLSTSAYTGITLYEPGALTIVARAGTPVAEIEEALISERQMLAFEPMDHRPLLATEGVPTIGGVVAANVSGPRRVQAGACRDFLLGVRFVDGTGAVVKNGGRVMKNVTGYDLSRLMAGSRGTLGILTEVSLKVLPKPETAAVLLLNGLGVRDAVGAMSTALRSPYEVSGAAHVPVGLDGTPVTMLRVEGFETSVDYRSAKLKEILANFGAADIERRTSENGGYGTDAGWRWVRDAEVFRSTEQDVWRISVKPSYAPGVVESLGDATTLLDWGGGLVWAGVAPGTDVRGLLSGLGGHATLVRAGSRTHEAFGTLHPEPAPLAVLSRRLKEKFDPRNILNPGLVN